MSVNAGFSVCFLANLKWHGLLRNLFKYESVRNRGLLFPKKNSISLLCISFSKNLSILDNREIGQQLNTTSLESFLWMWITFSVFKIVGNVPA